MEALVMVGGAALPEPSSYSAVTSTIVDSARNVAGFVCGSIVRTDVAKIEMSWKYLTAEQWAYVLTLFSNSFTNEVRFYNQGTATYQTRTMYVSDRTAGMWRRHPISGAIMGWTNCSLSLVEV
jgi:hypothetical protein